MNRKLVNTLFLMMLMAAVMLSASVARADSLTLVLDNPNQGGSLGQALTYAGTITADAMNSGAITLIGDACTPSGPTTCDDSPLFDLLTFDLAAGASFHGDLFTITIDPNAAYGIYAGAFFVYATNAAGDFITNDVDQNNDNFSAAVPEPASLLLLGSGLVGVIRRKRQK
jgi:hypothetical protein